MPEPFLATKFLFPPPRRNLVHRPRLVARLAEGVRGPLTLLSAPPGYGKTTLLCEWRADAGRDATVAWLSLDESDSDPARFLAGVVSALALVKPGLLDTTARLLQSGYPAAPETIITSLINEVSASDADIPGGVILILDDYHVIQTPVVHDALAFLLLHMPPALHLVIIGREDPPLPLAKLRVRGELVEIREGDLQFTAAETAAFLSQTMGLTISESGIAGLAERTEGWIAALQIAGLSLQNRGEAEDFIASFSGDDRYVMDYLMDEVFGRQPAQIQEFLLQTSILERLSASLCDAVISLDVSGGLRAGAYRNGVSASQSALELLERANLFVVCLDNRRDWYRYHRLFADLLRFRLQRTRPERVPDLHRRAGRWYAQAGDPDEAMRHALAAPDMELAAGVVEQYMLQIIGSGRIATYLGWVQRLPEELILRRAYLCAGCGWAYVLINQLEAALRFVDAGEKVLPAYRPVSSAPDGRRIEAAEVAGNLLAIRSYVNRQAGDLEGAIARARDALSTLPADADAIRCAVALNLGMLYMEGGEIEPAHLAFGEALQAAGRSGTNAYVASVALSQLGAIAAMQGRLREADGLFRRSVGSGTASSGPGIEINHGWMTWLHYQRNDIPAAQEHLDHVLQAAGQMGAPETMARAFGYGALLCQCRGEFEAAEAWFVRIEELARTHRLEEPVATECACFRVQYHLLRGEYGRALGLLGALGIRSDDLEQEPAGRVRPRLAGYVLLARVLAAQGSERHADALLERVCLAAKASPNAEVLLQVLTLRAVLSGSLDHSEARGLPYLEQALNLAAPEDFVRPILDAGSGLASLLRQSIMQGIQPVFAQRLLVELAEDVRRRAVIGAGVEAKRDLGSGLEPPTERERQVLRLLAAGLSSNEVAEELVISVSTARSYIKSLYAKLDAHSRVEAIERGRRLGFL